MLDLIYVNVIVIAFDILEVKLVYTNQLSLSHPIQTFRHILKLRPEFVVLNQLMAVATRGLRRQSLQDKRYHHDPSTQEGSPSHEHPSQKTETSRLVMKANSPEDFALAQLPSSTHSSNSEPDSNELDHVGFARRKSSVSYGKPLTQTSQLLRHFSEAPSQIAKDTSHQSPSRPNKHLKPHVFRWGNHSSHGDRGDDAENEEEEINLYLWERRAAVVLKVPWLQSDVEAWNTLFFLSLARLVIVPLLVNLLLGSHRDRG